MFYKSIAEVYDYIFPKNAKQLEFIEKLSFISENDKILDIGCATGNLTEIVFTKCKNVIGIDLDDDLISIAKEKSNEKISYKKMNMLNLSNNFEKNSIDKIISFGNTLVHLPDRDNVKSYFESVFNVLKEDGAFLVQIINYNRIINQNINHLPTINNEHVEFVRNYVYDPNNKSIEFKTKLTIKSTGQIIENNIPLLTLTKEELETFLLDAGFKNIKFYGSLDNKELTDSSIPLLFSCSK